jgi:uncharacterized protein YggE
METLFTNRKFIKASIALVVVLSLFVLVLFINEIKASGYIGGQNMPTISVSGEGDVMATSDIATITVNLSKDGTTTKEAQDALNTSIASTLAYLKTQNIADADIQSQYGGLSPKYGPTSQIACFAFPCPPQSSPKIVGYTAAQSITIKVRAVDSASDVRTGLANLGITDISGPDFTIDNPESYNDQARAKAIADAQSKAQVLAKELGVHLGKITSFSEDNNGVVMPMAFDAKAMSVGSAAAAPAPVLPTGQNKITSNVNITYEIK